MDDSFAERMRNRALQRLQRNTHLRKENDINPESVFKKQIVSTNIILPENKENVMDNLNSVINTKPVIAEHLTVRKSFSIDKMDCDASEIFKNLYSVNSEDKSENIKLEDIYVTHCKSRLANLAGKFKRFEEEDSCIPVRSAMKSKRSAENQQISDVSLSKNSRCEAVTKSKNDVGVFTSTQKTNMPRSVPSGKNVPKLKVKENVYTDNKTPNETVLGQSVVKKLESQGCMRTVPDVHPIYDFKQVKNKFNKENITSQPGRKLDRNVAVYDKFKDVQKSQEISNLYFNAKYESNVFIQYSRKCELVDSPDPSQLSVAERRKLFEKNLNIGNKDEKPIKNEDDQLIFKSKCGIKEKSKSLQEIKLDENISGASDSNSNISFCSAKHCEEREHTLNERMISSSDSATTDHEISSDYEKENNIKKIDLSAYPVLQTVKQVKFVSTPKPGHLYPSISDLDCDPEDELNQETHNRSYVLTNSHDDSFGRDVLFATNTIFSSFQNSNKDTSDVNVKSRNVLDEIKEPIRDNNEASSSSNRVDRSLLRSIKCDNGTASFTSIKSYSNNNSVELSPIPFPTVEIYSENINQHESKSHNTLNFRVEENEKNCKLTVEEKIKLLEEQIIKEKIMLTQAVRALKLCLSSSFLNSVSHLEAEKHILLSQSRIGAAQNEIDRIKVENSMEPLSSASNSVRGNVIISNIRLPVRMAVVHADLKDDIYNNLLCIIKCGDIVLATEVLPVTQNNIKQDPDCTYIEFSSTPVISNVSSDFKISVEVYNLIVEKTDLINGKNNQASKKDKKKQFCAKKEKESKMFLKHYSEEKKNSHSSFVMVGYMIFSLAEIRRHQWILNKQDLYHTPLVGMILMKLKCNLALTTIQKHGFLTMYEVISGYGAWSRYWFYLKGDILSFWKYPEEETVKDPMYSFNLKKCCTNIVDVAGIEITARPHTFMLQFSPLSYLLTDDRLLLSADDLEKRIAWCSCLNEVLKSVRLWSNSNE